MNDLIEKYARGELSGAEKNALEKEALNDPFLADALEGFEMEGAQSALDASKEALVNSSTVSIAWGKIILGTAVTAAIIFGVTTLIDDTEEPLIIEEIPDAGPSENLSSDLIIESITREDFQEEEIIPKQEERIILIEEQPNVEEKYEFEEEELVAIPFEELEPIATIESGSDAIKSDAEKPRKLIRASNMDLDYFYHLKVVDYSGIYRKSIRVNKTLDHGTPAYIEGQNTDNGVRIEFDESQWVEYMDFLEPTMKHVSRGRNKLALKNFEIIFDNFPEDANAEFYSGLCNFYLERYDRAIELFDAVKENKINTFDEEADWHRLLAYKSTGQKALFGMLKKEITELGGFYAERAEGLEF
ncbi:MAG: hypothetical protein AAF487_06260 [Bacteroidota bacterium]